MFGDKEYDKLAYVAHAERQALQRCNGNQIAAAEMAASWLQHDRRFDALDAKKVIERTQHCRSNGAKLDLNAPELRKGGQAHDGWKRPPVRG